MIITTVTIAWNFTELQRNLKLVYVLICFGQIQYFLNFFQILYFSGNPPVEVAAVDQQGDERRRLSELRTFTNLQLHQIIKFFFYIFIDKILSE